MFLYLQICVKFHPKENLLFPYHQEEKRNGLDPHEWVLGKCLMASRLYELAFLLINLLAQQEDDKLLYGFRFQKINEVLG